MCPYVHTCLFLHWDQNYPENHQKCFINPEFRILMHDPGNLLNLGFLLKSLFFFKPRIPNYIQCSANADL